MTNSSDSIKAQWSRDASRWIHDSRPHPDYMRVIYREFKEEQARRLAREGKALIPHQGTPMRIKKDPKELQNLKELKDLRDRQKQKIKDLERQLDEERQEKTKLQRRNESLRDKISGAQSVVSATKRLLDDKKRRILFLEDESINLYQKKATAYIQPGHTDRDTLLQGVLGLSGEVGEIANSVEKITFQHHDDIKGDTLQEYLTKELGDVAWYFAEVATAADIRLSDVLNGNLEKLGNRYSSGSFSKEESEKRKDQE